MESGYLVSNVSQGKVTEIKHINGTVLRNAKKLGIICQVNEKMCALTTNLKIDLGYQSNRYHLFQLVCF
ncbi:ketopantoate reductase C-terminal domain-containing protein [Paraglaciecola sp.]|uniref:ketopantoate reductase C-terminal domain-containing protein n=1 Tax=Paraglaciecola sp. TaxID=1920173 RepID=UPI00387E2F80